MTIDLETLTKEERAFLHDIATPLSALTLSVDLVIGYMDGKPVPLDKMKVKLEKAKTIIAKISEQLAARRNHIIERSGTTK